MFWWLEQRIRSQDSCVQLAPVPLIPEVAIGKSFPHSVPQFPHVSNADNDTDLGKEL